MKITKSSSTVPNDAVITVCRYLRPVALFETGYGYSNLGGTTFVFKMDYSKRTVDVKFSICRANENFNKKEGLRFAERQDGDTYNLDRFQALADDLGGFTNAYLSLLNSKYVAGTLTPRESTLFNTMSELQDSIAALEPTSFSIV